jgi:hypothetical protein
MSRSGHPVADVAVISDEAADRYEAARAAYDQQKRIMDALAKRLRAAEGPVRAQLGDASIGVRENGRAVCQRDRSVIGGGYQKIRHRDDLRAIHASFIPTDRPEGNPGNEQTCA